MTGYLLIYSVICTAATVHGLYWSKWSSCTVSCGQGRQLRKRTCVNQPSADGTVCTPENVTESRSCFTQGCVDGVWSDWTSWGQCSPNTRMKSRTRMCDNPPASVFGKPCEGVAQQFNSCSGSTSSTQSILFNAHNPVDAAPHAGTNIIYGTIVTNEGNGYNNNTGDFVAPVTGVYSFFVQLCTSVSEYVSVHLVAANKIIASCDHIGENFGCSTTQSVTILHKGETASVNVTHADRRGLYETPSRWNAFSGYLVHT